MDLGNLEGLLSWFGRPEVLPLLLMVAAISALAIVSLRDARTATSEEPEG